MLLILYINPLYVTQKASNSFTNIVTYFPAHTRNKEKKLWVRASSIRRDFVVTSKQNPTLFFDPIRRAFLEVPSKTTHHLIDELINTQHIQTEDLNTTHLNKNIQFWKKIRKRKV